MCDMDCSDSSSKGASLELWLDQTSSRRQQIYSSGNCQPRRTVLPPTKSLNAEMSMADTTLKRKDFGTMAMPDQKRNKSGPSFPWRQNEQQNFQNVFGFSNTTVTSIPLALKRECGFQSQPNAKRARGEPMYYNELCRDSPR
jgi:hypothetical protein